MLKNYCSADPDSKPEGIMGKSLLIVGGAHCRLSNISEDGKWLQSESFWMGSKHVQHEQGKLVGNML